MYFHFVIKTVIKMGNIFSTYCYKCCNKYEEIQEPSVTDEGTNVDGNAPISSTEYTHLEDEEVIEPSVSSIVSSLSGVKISASEPGLDFPFLCDSETISYIKSSQTMFLMRGVSGTGKSTIARAIQTMYPSAVLCSADTYFMKGGEYKFRSAELESAHKYCQDMAVEAVRNQANVIIIDNTNVKRWEMKFYMDLARQNSYHLVIVQPKTEWKNDPKILSSRNIHDVDEDTIRKKIRAFEDYVPFYYAWFLNREDSIMVYKKCCRCLTECIESIPRFCYAVLGKDCSVEELLEYFKLTEMHNTIYHCTAKFLGGWKSGIVGRLEYHQNPDVQQACGQSFKISMTGLIVTRTVVAARIKLTSKESLKLYDKPEENVDGILPRNTRHLKGSSAHLTIATAEGIPPKQSNSELLTVVEMERNNTEHKASHAISCGVVDIWDRKYCSITFDKPKELNTLFSGW